MPRMTKGERLSRKYLMRYLYEQTLDQENLSLALRDRVPTAWHTLESDLDVEEPKLKVTLRLDESVARFYRAMGAGYQGRINRILSLWAHMKIADAMRVEEAIQLQLKELNDKDDARLAAGKEPVGF